MIAEPTRFVAFANGKYSKEPLLPRAAPDARSLGSIFEASHGFRTFIFEDVDPNSLQSSVSTSLRANSLRGGTLVLSWTGHALIGENGSLRLLGTYCGIDIEVATTGRLAEWAAGTGASQILLIIDTCSAGSGVLDAAALAAAVTEHNVNRKGAWFGVVAASLAGEPSLSGALSRQMCRLVTNGPCTPSVGWEPTREYIHGDDLLQAVRDDWQEPRQTPQILCRSSHSWNIIRNPLFERGPDIVVEDLLHAARGHSDGANYFTGRTSSLAKIVAWIRDRKPGMFVVTGPPGCGKSALLGRVVSLSSKEQRSRMRNLDELPDELDPKEGSIHAHASLRGLTVEAVAEKLLRGMGRDPNFGTLGLLGIAKWARKSGAPLAFVVDALDEAGEWREDVAATLLRPLAQDSLLLIGTRDIAVVGEQTTISLLDPVSRQIELDNEPRNREDIRDYVIARLSDVSKVMNPCLVGDVVSNWAERSGGFLLARLIASQLGTEPVDTSVKGWQEMLSTTVENALERDLRSVSVVIDSKPNTAAARELLQALVVSHGNGLPIDHVWPAIATTMSDARVTYTRDDIHAALPALGKYVIAASEDGQPVYRLAHQHLVDYLSLRNKRPTRQLYEKSMKVRIADVLAELCHHMLDVGDSISSGGYLYRHAWRHFVDAANEGITLLRDIVRRETLILSWLGNALEVLASRQLGVAIVSESLASLEEAVAIWRELGEKARLATALFNLSATKAVIGDQVGADAAAIESATVADAVVESDETSRLASLALLGRASVQLSNGNFTASRVLAARARRSSVQTGDYLEANNVHVRVAIGLIESKATAALGDLESAFAIATGVLKLIDESQDGERPELLTEVLSTLLHIRLVLSAQMSGRQSNAVSLSASCTEGARAAALHRNWQPESVVAQIALERALYCVVAAMLLDSERGIKVTCVGLPAMNSLANVLDGIYERTLPHANRFPEAAWTAASARAMRGRLRGRSERNIARADREHAIALLEVFSSSNNVLGVTWCGLIGEGIAEAITDGDISPSAARQLALKEREATARLRKIGPLGAEMLVDALAQTALLWQIAGEASFQEWALVEAIEETRRQFSYIPNARRMLALLLCDLAGLNVYYPPISAQLSLDAYKMSQELPAGADTEWSLAISEFNLAAARINMHQSAGVEELLTNAITRLKSIPETSLTNRMLGVGFCNLSNLHIRNGKYSIALAAARKARVLLQTVQGYAYAFNGTDSVVAATFAEGACLKHLGESAKGDAIIDGIIEDALLDLRVGADNAPQLAALLNGCDSSLWDAVLFKLRDRTDLVRKIKPLRIRPLNEMNLTVSSLMTELAYAGARGAGKLRSIIRWHRLIDPELFDSLWREKTGELPAWLTLDHQLIGLVTIWLNSGSLKASKAYLEEHLILLDGDTEAVLEEMRCEEGSGQWVDQAIEVLTNARQFGIEEAYKPLIVEDAVREWLASDRPVEYIIANSELLRPEVSLYVDSRVGHKSAFDVLAAILTLANRGEIELAHDIENFPSKGWNALIGAMQFRDTVRVSALAVLVRAYSTDARLSGLGAIALAVGFVMNGQDKKAEQVMREIRAEPAGLSLEEIINTLTPAIAHHRSYAPALAGLLYSIGREWLGSDA